MASIDLRPRLGHRATRANDRLLLVCFFDPNGISTVYENIALWQRLSRYKIEILNLWPGGRRGGTLAIPNSVELDDYAGLIVHCTACYFPANLQSLDRLLERSFESWDGLKILMKQDEQVHTSTIAQYVGQKRFDLVITCVPAAERDRVYPRDIVGDVSFLQAFTGYVSPFMRELGGVPMAARTNVIGYRGSIQPLEFGRLGFEKRKIGYDVGAAVASLGDLKIDISSRWEDRILGTAWFDFLKSSKVVLGVESGSNLFDFTGEVARWCRDYEARHPDADRLGEAFYLKAHEEYLHAFEGNVNYAQISPRHFEAAAARAAQVLYEGDYSDVFLPHRHFLPLRRDLSNFDEVADFVRDEQKLQEFADRTYEEVILNPQYHYEHFVSSFDQAVEAVLDKKGRSAPRGYRPAETTAQRALLLMAHEPTVDPRIEWMSQGLASTFEVCELGTYRFGLEETGPSYERLSERRARVRIERQRHDWDWLPAMHELGEECPVGLHVLTTLYMLAELPAAALARVVGALDADEADLTRFRQLCQHFILTNGGLIQAARLIGEFDVIVATDLETLPAALVLAQESAARVLYDAHEYWPYSYVSFTHWEVEFWSGLERLLAPRAQLRAAVSPHLAELMAREYGCAFLTVPNCATLASGSDIDLEAAFDSLRNRDEVIFLFQGVFAPARGVEDLIAAWQNVDPRARLLLRGPDTAFKAELVQLARSLGLLDRSVFFPDAVPESRLVQAAREADIGLIPYRPENIVYRYSCPNKLSQYMAAGLPVLCNELDYVKSVVVDNGIGAAVAFADHSALASLVNEWVTSKEQIIAMSRRSRAAFLSGYHWEAVSREMFGQLRDLTRTSSPRPRLELDFSWMENAREMRRSATELGSAVPIFPQSAQAYRDEIARLNQIYPAEIKRIEEAYGEQARAYQADIARLQQVYPAEIARLKELARSYGITRHRLEKVAGTLAQGAIAVIRAGRYVRRQADRVRSKVSRTARTGSGP